jgi:hypothetical protein
VAESVKKRRLTLISVTLISGGNVAIAQRVGEEYAVEHSPKFIHVTDVELSENHPFSAMSGPRRPDRTRWRTIWGGGDLRWVDDQKVLLIVPGGNDQDLLHCPENESE